ncbi:hypothetical protein FRC00_002480 [Tulasnella sp. 408]|nr:hypothetical protein FRC00_002480 [Tulasnella sp. 408]
MEICPPVESLLPIDWLPLEAIIEILRISLPFEVEDYSPYSGQSPNWGFARAYSRQLWDLRRVCKTWLSVIDGTPSFWPAVSSQVPRQINTTVLLRSSGRPLAVYYTDPDASIKPDDPELLEFMTPARTSWKALAIKSAETMSFHNWLNAPAPNVEKIHLDHCYGTEIMVNRPVLLRGKTKNVREVSIVRVALPWSVDMFSSLRVLNLRGPGLGIGMDYILSFLSQSPSLEILCLTHTVTQVWTPETTRHPIKLPQLRTLEISEGEEAVTRGLFRHITPPPLLTCLRVHFLALFMSNGRFGIDFLTPSQEPSLVGKSTFEE